MTQHLHVPGEDLRLKKNLSLLSTPKMKPLPILLLASFIWMITAMQIIAQEDGGAIATLSRVEGYVEVFSEAKRKTRRGREGLMLFAGERINTGKDSKVTVEFRDGSTFRLFRKTDFLIEEGVEQNTRERSFKYQLSMKLGSLHGRMKRGMQRTRLRTPTAIVGVKGTTVRITETSKGKATIGLSEGKIEVTNAVSSIELKAGQWLPEIGRTDELDEKIAKLPNLLFLKTEEYELDFSDQQSKQLFISIQMEDSQSGKMTKRGGPVRLETDYYSVQMPQQVFLESDGFIRFPIEIDPPRKDDSEFDGLIQIRANMDDIGFDDVGEGMMVLRVVNGQRKRSLLIDPQSDLIEKR